MTVFCFSAQVSEEERKKILQSPEFEQFFEKTTKVVREKQTRRQGDRTLELSSSKRQKEKKKEKRKRRRRKPSHSVISSFFFSSQDSNHK